MPVFPRHPENISHHKFYFRNDINIFPSRRFLPSCHPPSHHVALPPLSPCNIVHFASYVPDGSPSIRRQFAVNSPSVPVVPVYSMMFSSFSVLRLPSPSSPSTPSSPSITVMTINLLLPVARLWSWPLSATDLWLWLSIDYLLIHLWYFLLINNKFYCSLGHLIIFD